MEKTRFDLEQDIMNCWNVTEDIKSFIEVKEKGKFTEDGELNFLLGLVAVYDMKFEKLLDTFASTFGLRND